MWVQQNSSARHSHMTVLTDVKGQAGWPVARPFLSLQIKRLNDECEKAEWWRVRMSYSGSLQTLSWWGKLVCWIQIPWRGTWMTHQCFTFPRSDLEEVKSKQPQVRCALDSSPVSDLDYNLGVCLHNFPNYSMGANCKDFWVLSIL